MPRIVDKLTEKEKEIGKKIRRQFSEEQMCAYFLTKTVRSQYQFDDNFIKNWYGQIFDKPPEKIENARRDLVQAYTTMLMFENKYRFHLDYWLRQYQEKLLSEMEEFFSGVPGE